MKLVFFNKIESCNLKSKRGIKKFPKEKKQRKQNSWFMVLRLKAKKLLTVVAPIFLSVKMGQLHYHGQKGKSQKVNVLCPTIIKEYNSHMIRVDIHDQLTTIYEIYQKSRSQYYLRVFFHLMDSVVTNAYIIYKKKVNARLSLFHFKVILVESLISSFYSQKRKFTSGELQLALELIQALKEPAHVVHSTEKRQRRKIDITIFLCTKLILTFS